MDFGPLELLTVIVGISILVIVHESGHYLVARAFKMRVLRYSIGIGPALFRYKPKDSPTTFQVCAIPFLAYVQIAGMNPHEDVEPDDPDIFANKGLFARIATIAAGPAANYLAASVMAFVLALSGWPTRDVNPDGPLEITTVQEGTPAAEAGLLEGDIVVEANAQPITNISDLIEVTKPRPGMETLYVIERSGERMEFSITPEDREGTGVIGVATGRWIYPTYSVGEAAERAVMYPYEFTGFQLKALANFNVDDLGGPVRMGEVVAKAADDGFPHYIHILIVLSIALGFFNLLPLPALDGGRLLFLAFEVVTRQKPNAKAEAVVHAVGILFLLGVLVMVTYRDIARLL